MRWDAAPNGMDGTICYGLGRDERPCCLSPVLVPSHPSRRASNYHKAVAKVSEKALLIELS